MPIRPTSADGGSESPKEDYPWRPIPMSPTLHDLGYLNHRDATINKPLIDGGVYVDNEEDNGKLCSQTIMINPASCLMCGLDVTAKMPICGLGVPFVLSEFDFVWLAVYFDQNLRPMHAAIQKGPKFTRWYEYGGISMGGFPRTVKTVRRDHIGVDIGTADADGFVKPDIIGPEYDYIGHEVDKEVEYLSPYGFLGGNEAQIVPKSAGGNFIDADWAATFPIGAAGWTASKLLAHDNLKKALQSEQTYFLLDGCQVKQWAAYTLLGYCTSTPPDPTWPYPNVPLAKWYDSKAGTPQAGTLDKSINFWYRQVATEHLMLQETNAGGVRANMIVPGFSPYIEALPHPKIISCNDPDFGAGNAAMDEWIAVIPSDGIQGTLPDKVINDAKYDGPEVPFSNWKEVEDAPNNRSRLALPGENALPSVFPAGVLGATGANIWIRKSGAVICNQTLVMFPAGKTAWDGRWKLYTNSTLCPNAGARIPQPHGVFLFDAEEVQIYVQKERCMDSAVITLRAKPDDNNVPLGEKRIYYVYGNEEIDTGYRLPGSLPANAWNKLGFGGMYPVPVEP